MRTTSSGQANQANYDHENWGDRATYAAVVGAGREMQQKVAATLLMAICIKPRCWDLPGGPVAKTPSYQRRGRGLDPCSGNQVPHDTTKILHAIIKRQHS